MARPSYDRMYVPFVIAALLQVFSWWHLGRLQTLECLHTCDAPLERYRTLLRVEAGLLLASAAMVTFGRRCPDAASRVVKPVTKSPRAALLVTMTLLGALLVMHVMQWRTLHTLRRCACVAESDVDLATTLIAGERMVKILGGVVAIVILISTARKLARLGLV
jgi:hypothetical protein